MTPSCLLETRQLFQAQLVLIVTGTVTDVPQTSPHLVSGVIIVYVIDNTALLQQA
jgi:hypothetical protein